jgi:HK97 family phage prohead protease
MEKEYRTFDLTEIRVDGGESPKIVGYAAVFGKMSEDLGGFREKIRKGAFAKTIKEGDIRGLFNHDPNFVLGRNKSGTLELEEDDKGLRISLTPPKTQIINDLVIEPMRRGDISQMSFGFRTIKDEWEDKSTRELVEVRLFDISPVTFPAYPQTSVKVRSLVPPEVIGNIEQRLRDGATLDEWDISFIKRSIDILRSYLPAAEPVQADHSVDVEEPVQADHLLDVLRRKLDFAEKFYK